MKQAVLVVTSVHPPDDPRIRHKLVETLRTDAAVTLAVQTPGPADPIGFDVVILRRGRLARSLAASRLIVTGAFDAVSVHDPELLPAALIARLRRRRVVFDLHENLPAQLRTKPWLPRLLRPIAAGLAAMLLRLVERVVEVTLAEDSYAALFRRAHPVFPNYLAVRGERPELPDRRRGIVYLGDITEERGLLTALEAVGRAAVAEPVTLIGRCSDAFRRSLDAAAAAGGVELTLTGFLPPPEAWRLVANHRLALSPLHDTPNYRQSLPTKLLEYLALGVPVVASDLPGSRAALATTPGIVWVAPGDPDALAAAIAAALGDDELARAAAEGAAEVRATYQWPAEDVRRFYLGAA